MTKREYLVADVEHWTERAKETYDLLEGSKHKNTRNALLEIARLYEELAEAAEALREKSITDH